MKHMMVRLLALATALLSLAVAGDLETALDRQDRAALESAAARLSAAAGNKPSDADAQYRAAVAWSYLAEVGLELRDKALAQKAAETGIPAAEKAIALKPNSAEYHRILGTLCGQVIPANVLLGFKYGKRAQDEIAKAVELDPRLAVNYVSRGVGNYYLPAALGGGVERAIEDFQKAIQLDPKLAAAHMWLGVALRKANRNSEARGALSRSLELNPNRLWTKQQLEKTPAK